MPNSDSHVIVIDDDSFVREAIVDLLHSIGQTALAYGSTAAFLAAPPPDRVSCLVLDVRLPGRSGLEFQQEMAVAGLHMPVVFITGHGDIPMSVAAMKAGAIEFLTKPFRDQDLLDAVHRGLELDRQRRAGLDTLRGLRTRWTLLTPREREVMAHVAAGRSNKQIAAALGVSEITVKVHRGNVMQKMQAASVPDLVRIADRLGATPKV